MNSRELRQMEQEHDAERVINNEGGMQSKTSFDFTLLPSVQGLFDVIKVLTDNSDEYGGHYPRNNWRKLSDRDNFNHAMQHVLEAFDSYEHKEYLDTYEHINHAICRLMFLQWSLNEDNQNE